MKEKTRHKNYQYIGKIINLRCDEAELSNGKSVLREVVEHPGGVGILAIKDGYVWLVNQFRYPFMQLSLEIPAGKLEANEHPMHTGLRELQEEIGAITNTLTPLGKMYPSPGYTNEIIHLYLTTEFEIKENNPDEDEFLSIEKMRLEDAYAMIDNGTIIDAKTIIALLKYKDLKKKEV